MSIKITLTATQEAAISLVALDVEHWCVNAIAARAAAALYDLRQRPEWASALTSALAAGVDVRDEAAVLRHGFAAGIIETAAQIEARYRGTLPAAT